MMENTCSEADQEWDAALVLARSFCLILSVKETSLKKTFCSFGGGKFFIITEFLE